MFDRIDCVLEQVDEDLEEAVSICLDVEIIRDAVDELDFFAEFVAEEPEGGFECFLEVDGFDGTAAGVGKRTQVRDDIADAVECGFHIVEALDDRWADRLRGLVGAASEAIEVGGGEVERVIDFVDDSGAESAEGGEFLGLDELDFGFLELFDRGLEEGILVGELELEDVVLDEVMDANFEFCGGEGFGEEVIGTD